MTGLGNVTLNKGIWNFARLDCHPTVASGLQTISDAQGNTTTLWLEFLDDNQKAEIQASRCTNGVWELPTLIAEAGFFSKPSLKMSAEGDVIASWYDENLRGFRSVNLGPILASMPLDLIMRTLP